MRRSQYELSEKEIRLLLDIIPQCELFNVKLDDCKRWYGMTQMQAKKKSMLIMDKLVRQRELLKQPTDATTPI